MDRAQIRRVPPQESGEGRGWPTRRKVILAVVLALMVVAVGLIVLRETGPLSLEVPGVPGWVGNQKLFKAATGEEGKKQIGQMHGHAFDFTEAYVAEYRGGSGSTTAWISRVKSDTEAQALLDGMVARIGQGNETFTDLQQLTVDGRIVYSTVGNRQQHYFWVKGDTVIWIGLSAADPKNLLRKALTVKW
ncbi:MAG: hypothetical protein M1358_13905 [Chloroflexi bacterium]|nr:hypothetical protein [Chloroflexota bacterium]